MFLLIQQVQSVQQQGLLRAGQSVHQQEVYPVQMTEHLLQQVHRQEYQANLSEQVHFLRLMMKMMNCQLLYSFQMMNLKMMLYMNNHYHCYYCCCCFHMKVHNNCHLNKVHLSFSSIP